MSEARILQSQAQDVKTASSQFPLHTDASAVAAQVEIQQQHIARGEAAYLLVESILIGLVEQRVLDKDQLLGFIDGAILCRERSEVAGLPPDVAARAAGALTRFGNSVMSIRAKAAEPSD